jgi:uncharacterized membrane protein YciS (DUF1049 family)
MEIGEEAKIVVPVEIEGVALEEDFDMKMEEEYMYLNVGNMDSVVAFDFLVVEGEAHMDFVVAFDFLVVEGEAYMDFVVAFDFLVVEGEAYMDFVVAFDFLVVEGEAYMGFVVLIVAEDIKEVVDSYMYLNDLNFVEEALVDVAYY